MANIAINNDYDIDIEDNKKTMIQAKGKQSTQVMPN